MDDSTKINELINCCEDLLYAVKLLLNHDAEVFKLLRLGYHPSYLDDTKTLIDSIESKIKNLKKCEG